MKINPTKSPNALGKAGQEVIRYIEMFVLVFIAISMLYTIKKLNKLND